MQADWEHRPHLDEVRSIPQILADDQEKLLRILVKHKVEMGVIGEPAIGQLGTSFMTRFGRLEVVGKAHGVGRFEDWARGATKENFGEGLVVCVAAAEDILVSKQAAGRAKDYAVIEQMREDLEASG